MTRPTILVASSEGQKIRNLVRLHLSQLSTGVDVLEDNVASVHPSSQITHDLLIVDLAYLPASQRLVTDVSQTAVILLVDSDERHEAIARLRQGAADYLLKPIDPIELMVKVDRVLEYQSLRRSGGAPVETYSPSAQDLLVLREASQEINQTLQLDEVLKIMLAQANQLPDTDVAKVYLADMRGNLERDSFVAKTSPLAETISESHLLFALATEAVLGLKVLRRTIQEDEAIWKNQPLQSALLIPLISADKVIGVLAVGSVKADAFSNNDVRWLSVFCEQAATAIENARLFQDLASAYIDLAQSREKILQSRNTLQVLFDGITDGLYILDQRLTITAINQVEARRQGYEVEALVGQSVLSLGWNEAAPELLEHIKESLQTGRETTWLSPENESSPDFKDREYRIYPIRNRLAHIEQVVIFAQDVSERRQWQASLFRSANLVAVGQLAGSVAHQINNPLTIAMANSQLLLLEMDPASEMYDLTSGIYKAGERIQTIVENLLEFSNQETYFFVQTDLVNTIEGALALVLRSLKKARIEVVKRYQVQPKLSASISHLKLVWMNLLLNARDAVAHCTEQPQIIIAIEQVSDREVKVSIIDNGVGIPPENFDQLFRPFFTTKLARKALGLGLYSAHTIVERHNGRIDISSRPNEETRFEVILPLDNPRDL